MARKGQFKEGEGGRKPGSQNKLTRTVKEAVRLAFMELQKDSKVNLVKWAKENPKDFYNIAAKLIPTELSGTVTQKIIKVVRE